MLAKISFLPIIADLKAQQQIAQQINWISILSTWKMTVNISNVLLSSDYQV